MALLDCPSGVIVYFRMMADNNQAACAVHLDGRDITYLNSNGDVTDRLVMVVDEHQKVIGIYERDFICAILPLTTIGPATEVGNVNPSR